MNLATATYTARAWYGVLHARLDALPARERYVALAGALALLLAADGMLVLPMKHKRERMANAAQEQAQSESDAATEAQRAQDEARLTLENRATLLDAELAKLGASKSTGEPLNFLLSRTLREQGVQVTGLRELGAQELDALPGPEPAASSPPLYRHRWETRFTGEVATLTAAVQTLDRTLRPLRIERVRLATRADGALEAVVTFAVIGTERTWLAL